MFGCLFKFRKSIGREESCPSNPSNVPTALLPDLVTLTHTSSSELLQKEAHSVSREEE